MIPHSLAAVIFDMDGVLIDSEPLHYESTIRFLNGELGLQYNAKENAEFLGRSDADMFSTLKDRYQLPFTVEELINRRRDVYLSMLDGNVQLMPGVTEFIRYLAERRMQLAVASSSLERVIDLVLTQGMIKDYFAVVQSGEHLERGKPHPDIFVETARRLNVNPRSCLVIEDTTVGIQAAKAAGMIAIGFAADDHAAQDFSSADLVITSFADPQLYQRFH